MTRGGAGDLGERRSGSGKGEGLEETRSDSEKEEDSKRSEPREEQLEAETYRSFQSAGVSKHYQTERG